MSPGTSWPVRIASAIATMRRYNKIRAPYFQALLTQARKQALHPEEGRDIVRRPGNPMLRYAAGADQAVDGTVAALPTSIQETLNL